MKDKFKEQLNAKSMKFHYHDANTTILEGILARGDRKIAKIIYDVYKKGCIFDAWSEYLNYDAWMETFQENDMDYHFYTDRERSLEEVLPWDFIDVGVTKEFLIREWKRAVNEEVTPNCRVQCQGCGATVFEGGVCYENKN